MAFRGVSAEEIAVLEGATREAVRFGHAAGLVNGGRTGLVRPRIFI